jgi:hypothetical protein
MSTLDISNVGGFFGQSWNRLKSRIQYWIHIGPEGEQHPIRKSNDYRPVPILNFFKNCTVL